jgi:hypothetical protein
VIPPAGTYSNYWTDPYTLFLIEVVAMQFAELKRLQDFRFPGSQGKQYFLGLEKIFEGSGNPAYPGGPFFNLFNLGKTEAELKTLKLKEIKNGRLAMLACFGFGAQVGEGGGEGQGPAGMAAVGRCRCVRPAVRPLSLARAFLSAPSGPLTCAPPALPPPPNPRPS